MTRWPATPRPEPGHGARDAFAAELARVADRLRTCSLHRLDAPVPTGATRRQLAHDAAQRLADLAAGSTGRQPRSLPRLGVHGVADQVLVTGQDLLREGDDAALRAGGLLLAHLRSCL